MSLHFPEPTLPSCFWVGFGRLFVLGLREVFDLRFHTFLRSLLVWLLAAAPLVAQTALTPGAPAPFQFSAQSTPQLFNGARGFYIDVPENATRVSFRLSVLSDLVPVALHIRHGDDVTISNRVVADVSVTDATLLEKFAWLQQDDVQPGRYFVALGVEPSFEGVSGTITAQYVTGPTGVSATVTLPAIAQIMLAGQPAGTQIHGVSAPSFSPPLVPMRVTPGEGLRFEAEGQIETNFFRCPTVGPIGDDDCGGALPPVFRSGISSISGPGGALVGLFLGTAIDAQATPRDLIFTASQQDMEVVKPALQQPFYIGNGRTTSRGRSKTFVVPDGATRLFLGRNTSSTSDDTGALVVSVTQTGVPSRPPQNPVFVSGHQQFMLAGFEDGSEIHGSNAPLNSPPQVDIQLTPGAEVEFFATGTLFTNFFRCPEVGPEGSDGCGGSVSSFFRSGVSAISGPGGGLIGVFLGETIDASSTPPTLEFNEGLRQVGRLEPLLQQVFYIGNGRTPGGEVKRFVVPSGSTRLFLGSLTNGSSDDWGGFHVVTSIVGERPNFVKDGVTNAAGFGGGPISPGGVIALFGENLAGDVAGASSVPLPRNLDGVEVWFNDRPAPLFFVSSGQINAQVPWELQDPIVPYEIDTARTVQVAVKRNGVVSRGVTLDLEPFRPGIFQIAGAGPVVVNNRTGRVVTAEEPARKGDVLIIYASGLGAVGPMAGTGEGSPGGPLAVGTFPVIGLFAGGGGEIGVPALFSGLAPGFVGVFQVNVQVPDNAPSGTVDLFLQSAGFGRSNAAQIVIE